MLEVIDKGSCSQVHPVPILFVHGAWFGAWCWNNFIDFFAGAGYRAVAISLRGHGASHISKPLNACSIADYVHDVATTAADLGDQPVLVGHSLGGFVVQRYLESRNAAAAVLLASTPPRGIRTSSAIAVSSRFWRRHPWIAARSVAVGNLAGLVSTPALVREHLFSAHTPQHIVESCATRLQSESLRAAVIDPLARPIRTGRVTAPMLVLGADEDAMMTTADLRATARTYRTEAELFPAMGHNMMNEPGWGRVAERIHTWLQTLDLVAPRS
jgi:pimeloyl-ACP methyl ester carboxylesterase